MTRGQQDDSIVPALRRGSALAAAAAGLTFTVAFSIVVREGDRWAKWVSAVALGGGGLFALPVLIALYVSTTCFGTASRSRVPRRVARHDRCARDRDARRVRPVAAPIDARPADEHPRSLTACPSRKPSGATPPADDAVPGVTLTAAAAVFTYRQPVCELEVPP